MTCIDEVKAVVQLTVERDDAARKLAEAEQENLRLRQALQFAQKPAQEMGA
jgi:hypothetical protein